MSSAGSGDTTRAASHDHPGRDQDEFEAGPGYQPSTNQARDEPLPASQHDDSRQETGRGEPVRDDPPPRRQDGDGDNRQDGDGK